MWSTGSTSIMAKMPVLAGIECITIIADHDENGAGERAAYEAGQRWREAGREVRVWMPPTPGDFNDTDHAGRAVTDESPDDILARGRFIDLTEPANAAPFDERNPRPIGEPVGKPQRARTKPKRPERAARNQNDKRPTITIAAGDIERIVDEVEAALIAADRGLYQRDGRIVGVELVPASAAGGKKITVTSICERGDMALREDASSAAAFEKFDARVDGMVTADPPMPIIQTLQQRRGKLRFPVLAGVVHTPTMRADGSLLTKPGYDPATGLLFDPLGVTFRPIPDRPTRDDAVKALAEIGCLIEHFPFVTPAHRAVALSGILTALIRRCLRTAPFHAFSAPIRGSGKSLLVDVASVIATGDEAPVINAGGDDVELEKRLVPSLLAGSPIITIDNASRPIGGDLLCQMLTQTMVRPRILGKSETPTCPAGAFVAGTGTELRRHWRYGTAHDRLQNRPEDGNPGDAQVSVRAGGARQRASAATSRRRPDDPPRLPRRRKAG